MNKICRMCLEEGVLSSIFIKNFNISLCDMIEYCCNIKISRDDGLPDQMCSNCIYKLGVAYHFKQTCESADIRLRQYLGLRQPENYCLAVSHIVKFFSGNEIFSRSKGILCPPPVCQQCLCKFHQDWFSSLAVKRFTDASVMTDPLVTTTTIIKKCKCKLMEQRKSSSNYKKKPDAEKQKRGPKPKPKTEHACYQCDKQFRCQAQLDMHVRTHTGDKPFVCMYCPRSFSQKHNLTIHLRVHTGEKPFQCEVCSKRFSAQGNLQAHLKIHTGQRDHVCDQCNKSFITSSELTRHMSKHKGVRSFKCDLCNSAYVHMRDLKLHKLKKHQVLSQSSEMQNEGFNNSNNIDIIGIDVGKDVPVLPVKDSHHIAHLVSEKPERPTQDNQTLLPYEQKDIKDLYTQQYKGLESQNCTVCGESFNYMTELSHHYINKHKIYDYAAKEMKLYCNY